MGELGEVKDRGARFRQDFLPSPISIPILKELGVKSLYAQRINGFCVISSPRRDKKEA